MSAGRVERLAKKLQSTARRDPGSRACDTSGSRRRRAASRRERRGRGRFLFHRRRRRAASLTIVIGRGSRMLDFYPPLLHLCSHVDPAAPGTPARRSGRRLHRQTLVARPQGSASARDPSRRFGGRRGDRQDDTRRGRRRRRRERREKSEAAESGRPRRARHQRERLLPDGRHSAAGRSQAAVLRTARSAQHVSRTPRRPPSLSAEVGADSSGHADAHRNLLSRFPICC